MGLFSDPRVEMLMHQVSNLANRVEMLEKDARYVADQPQYASFFTAANAYGIDYNLVPLNQVVKAIVTHLDMQIEKIPEQTINKPIEVKVVKKPDLTTGAVLSTNGVNGTTWANVATMPAPMPAPKPKRKYTKRKPK